MKKEFNKKTIVINIGIIFIILVLSLVSKKEPKFKITKLSKTDLVEIAAKDFYREGCPVAPNRLKKIIVSYYDFDGKIHDDGEIVVMDTVAPEVENIFRELFAMQFPIDSVIAPYYFEKDYYDEELNNTSSFKCRQISNGDNMSIHSYGLAIDFNPIENPFVYPIKDSEKLALFDERHDGKAYAVWPAKGYMYMNRTKEKKGMVEPIVKIMKKNGFDIWGGHWDFPLDWMHFQTSRDLAEKLANSDKRTARRIWEEHLDNIKNNRIKDSNS